MREFYLPCYDNCKSFYKKAKVVETEKEAVLYSYGTKVASICGDSFTRLWDGYSATTMRHVNSFLEHYGFEWYGKAFWDSCEVNKPVSAGIE